MKDYWAEATRLLEDGRPNECVAVCQGAIDAHAADDSIYILISEAAIRLGRRDEGLRAAKIAVILSPTAASLQCFILRMSKSSRFSPVQIDREALYTWCRRCRSIDPRNLMASSVMFYNCLSILGDTEVAELSQVVGAHLNRDMATYFAAPHRDESVAYVNSSFALGYIGEMAQQFDALAKMMALGLLPKGIVYFVGNDRSVANKYLLDLWQGTVKTVGPDEVGQIGVQVDRVLHIDSSFLLVDGRYYWKDVAYALVQKAWERQRRKPIVALRRESKRLGRLLEQAGWYDVGNIAVLHLRETKYYADRGLPDDQTFRNSDVRNLKGPLKFLVDRGVRVVRIGASGVAAAPAVAGVFDYANCDFKSEELEIELVAASSLYLGSHSGPMSVAASFGIPNCIFDDPQMFYPQAASTTVFVPKIFVRDGRALTFEESCSQPVRHIESDSQLREYGIAVTNNTEDEILGVVEEAFHRYIAKDYVEPAPVRELRAKLRRIQERRNIVSMGDVGGKFLCKYEYLLREPPR